MVSPGFTPRDGLHQLVINALSVRSKVGAIAIIKSHLGLTPGKAEDYVVELQRMTHSDENAILFLVRTATLFTNTSFPHGLLTTTRPHSSQ